MNGSMNSGDVLVWCIEFRTGCNTHFSIEKKFPEKKQESAHNSIQFVQKLYNFRNLGENVLDCIQLIVWFVWATHPNLDFKNQTFWG